MKQTFHNLDTAKKERILNACIHEFGRYGFTKGSTDRIVTTLRISKGGLYEYIHSKEELFLYTVEQTYTHLYNYIRTKIKEKAVPLSADVLERIEFISSLAIDFYLEHPRYISLIVKTHELNDPDLTEKVETYFSGEFLNIFGDCDFSRLSSPKDKILDLLMWLLLKTRYDFLKETENHLPPEQIRSDYIKNWQFFIKTLKNGIY